MADDNLKRPTRRRVIIISKKMISNQVVPIANDKINSTTTAAQKESEDEEEPDYTISIHTDLYSLTCWENNYHFVCLQVSAAVERYSDKELIRGVGQFGLQLS